MQVEVVRLIWLAEGYVTHFMLGDIAIQFSIFIGSGAGGYYFCFSLLHIVVQQHLLSCLGSTLVVWWN